MFAAREDATSNIIAIANPTVAPTDSGIPMTLFSGLTLPAGSYYLVVSGRRLLVPFGAASLTIRRTWLLRTLDCLTSAMRTTELVVTIWLFRLPLCSH